MSKFQSMGKEDLRQACRDAGISYGKLNNDGMRAALEAKHAPVAAPVAPVAPAPVVVKQVDHSASNKLIADAIARDPSITAGAKVEAKTEGLKIEKNREERNGVKRPSVGGTCRAIWDELDSFQERNSAAPSAKEVKTLANLKGWNVNNANIEYYQWRKFHGIRGRQA